jgi:O-antigen/teichoic acid export membrane protein
VEQTDTAARKPDGDGAGGGLVRDVAPGRAALDVVAQIVGRGLNLVLGIVATAVLARGLGESGYGVWSTLLLVPSLLAVLNDLGLQQVAVRRATADDDPRWLGALLTARLALSVPISLLSVAVILAIGHGREMLIAGTIIALQGLLAAPSSLVSVFQARVRNDLTMVAATANSIGWTIAAIVLVHHGLIALAVAMAGIAALTIGGQAVLALRSVHVPLRGTSRLWRELARTAIPLSVASLLITAYGKLDGLILYEQAGAREAGLYNAAYRLLDQAAFIPLSLTVTLMPLVSRAWPRRPDQARAALQLALDLLGMAGLFALAFALGAAKASIVFLFGDEFSEASAVLPVLMAAFLFICWGYAYGVFTLVLDLQGRFIRVALVALVLNVAANLALIPTYGFRACAWITLATEMLVIAAMTPAIFRTLEMRPALGRLARAAAVATVVAVGTALLDGAGVPVIPLLVLAAAAYVGGLFALRAVTVGDVRALRSGTG